MRRLHAISLPTISPTAMATVILMTAIFCFSVGNILTRFADVGPSASAFYRLFLAMPMGWMWLYIFSQSRMSKPQSAATEKAPLRKIAPLGILCGVCFGGEVALLHYAYTQGSVGVAIFLNAFAPLFVLLGAWAFFGERPARKSIICLTIAAPGAFLLSGAQNLSDIGPGTIAALLSAVCYAGFLLVGTEMRKISNTRTVMNWTNLTACLMLAPLAIINQEQLVPLAWTGWGVLIAMAFVSQVLGMNLFTQAMGTLSSTVTSFFALTQPVMTMALAAWILDELLTLPQMIGAAVVFAALSLNNIRFKKTVK